MTYAAKLSKADGRLDWGDNAASLDRRVRAMTPWPGAVFMVGEEPIRVLAAEPAAGQGGPGTMLAPGLVACGPGDGGGALRLLRLQRPGKAALTTEDFLRGFALPERLA